MTPEAAAKLAAASVDTLMNNFASLTHRIHAYELEHGRKSATDDRAARDLIKTEIKRRTGDIK